MTSFLVQAVSTGSRRIGGRSVLAPSATQGTQHWGGQFLQTRWSTFQGRSSQDLQLDGSIQQPGQLEAFQPTTRRQHLSTRTLSERKDQDEDCKRMRVSSISLASERRSLIPGRCRVCLRRKQVENSSKRIELRALLGLYIVNRMSSKKHCAAYARSCAFSCRRL